MANKIQIKHGSGVPGGGKLSSFELGYATQTGQLYISTTGSNILGITPASHSHAYLPLSGGTLTGDLDVGGNIYINGSIVPKDLTFYNYSNGVLIDLIPATSTSTMLTIIVTGNAYGSGTPIMTLIQGYHYTPSGTFVNYSQRNLGDTSIGTAKFFLDGGRVKCWFSPGGSFKTLSIRVLGMGSYINNVTVTNAAEPTGTNKVTCTLKSGAIAWDNVTGKPTTATRWPTWSEVTSKPSTFAPSSHTHSYLPLSGGTVTGGITKTTTGVSWITGKTATNVLYFGATTQSAYHPMIRVNSYSGHVWNLGGLGNSIGIYGYYSGTTDNKTEWSTYWDTATGNLSHSKTLVVGGNIYEGGTALVNKYAPKTLYGTSVPSSLLPGQIYVRY